MSEDVQKYYVGDRKKCASCMYCKCNAGVINSQIRYCDYIMMEGRSRVWNLGKKKIEKGYCDKYKPKRRGRKKRKETDNGFELA